MADLPTNQDRKDAERELMEAVARLPDDPDKADHLPAFGAFAGRLIDIAAETRLRTRTAPADQGFLDWLVTQVVDQVLSEYADPDEWQRFARKGSRFPFPSERKALRKQLRQLLTRDRVPYWALRYGLGARPSGSAPTDSVAQRKARRAEMLTEAHKRWGREVPFRRIHRAAGVDHKDAYDGWRSGKLHGSSAMAKSIERILSAQSPPPDDP